ncbi:hypothetical protein D3C72_875420 [compost metagenome]
MGLTRKRGNLRQTLQQRLAKIAAGQRLTILQHTGQITVSGAVVITFQHQQIARRALANNVTGQQRTEVLSFALAVAHLDQIALKTLRISRRQCDTGLQQLPARNALLLIQLADHRHRPCGTLVELKLIDRARPEIAHPLSGQQQHNADQRQQADGHRPGGQPDPRRTALRPALHGASWFRV